MSQPHLSGSGVTVVMSTWWPPFRPGVIALGLRQGVTPRPPFIGEDFEHPVIEGFSQLAAGLESSRCRVSGMLCICCR